MVIILGVPIFRIFTVGIETQVCCTRAPDKRVIKDNSKIIFLISQGKHMLWPHIRIVSVR